MKALITSFVRNRKSLDVLDAILLCAMIDSASRRRRRRKACLSDLHFHHAFDDGRGSGPWSAAGL